jgi:hypothetical protein
MDSFSTTQRIHISVSGNPESTLARAPILLYILLKLVELICKGLIKI